MKNNDAIQKSENDFSKGREIYESLSLYYYKIKTKRDSIFSSYPVAYDNAIKLRDDENNTLSSEEIIKNNLEDIHQRLENIEIMLTNGPNDMTNDNPRTEEKFQKNIGDDKQPNLEKEKPENLKKDTIQLKGEER